jgi:hypothetical protein
MALSSPPRESFVPSFATLTDPDKPVIQKCIWHSSGRVSRRDSRVEGLPVRCSSWIEERYIPEVTRHLAKLRSGVAHAKERLDILWELSSLLLCQNHYRSNAETVFDIWVAEIYCPRRVSATHEVPQPARLPTLTCPHTPDAVLERLGITIGTDAKCHGLTVRGAHCTYPIRRSNRERIITIANSLARDWSPSNAARDLLEELSGLIMCVRFHRDQAPTKLMHWTALLNSDPDQPPRIAVRTTTDPYIPPRPVRQRSYLDETQRIAGMPRTPSRRLQSPVSVVTTPERRFNPHNSIRSTDSNESTAVQRIQTSDSPVSSRTRPSTTGQYDPTPILDPVHNFEPLTTVKTPIQVARYVMAKIEDRISPAEKPSGFVYGFRRPGCDLIKIGVTNKTVYERINTIGRSCKYNPIVVFAVETKHAMKVEHLVHRQLHRQNRRECLVSGRCNNGRGCPSKHKEWFEGVSDAYAENVVRAWARWIERDPYDVDGYLKNVWVMEAQRFDLSAQGDIWRRWTSTTLNDIQRESDEALYAAIVTERFLSSLSRLSPPESEVPLRYGSRIPIPRTVSVYG